MTPDVRRARTAFLWVGVILPLTVLAVSAVIVAFWLPEIPEPAAIHWGEDGVDGFGPGWTYLVVLGGIAAMVIAFALLAWFASELSPLMLSILTTAIMIVVAVWESVSLGSPSES